MKNNQAKVEKHSRDLAVWLKHQLSTRQKVFHNYKQERYRPHLFEALPMLRTEQMLHPFQRGSLKSEEKHQLNREYERMKMLVRLKSHYSQNK